MRRGSLWRCMVVTKQPRSALSKHEWRVLGVLGMDYVEGSSNCADSIPEEEHLQIALDDGNADVVLEIPTVPNTLNVDSVAVECVEELVAVVETAGKKSNVGKNAPPKKSKRTVLDSAREQFAAIAKHVADAITMQAEASCRRSMPRQLWCER